MAEVIVPGRLIKIKKPTRPNYRLSPPDDCKHCNWLCRRCSNLIDAIRGKSIITVEYLIMEYRKPPSFKFTWYPSISRAQGPFPCRIWSLVWRCEKRRGRFRFGNGRWMLNQSIKTIVVVSKVANHVSVYMHTQNGIGQMFTSSIQLNLTRDCFIRFTLPISL